MGAEPRREHEPSAAASDEDRFEEILARYIDRLNRGEILERERLATDEPALAAELWEHLAVFSGLDGGGRSPLPEHLGDYEIRRPLGRGGMGVVYEAWQDSMARRVALKVLPAALAVDPKSLARFLREAQIAGKLEHPHVVAVYGLGVENGVPHFAMEYVEGETLAQALARLKREDDGAAVLSGETPFGPTRARETYTRAATAFSGVAEGLHEAHALGVVHRDIKPSNLILDRRAGTNGEARLRVLDFGLAFLEGEASLTLSRDFVGTPRYVSPEQARGGKARLDHRSDVYSLGATLYEVLAGRPPFESGSVEETLSQIASAEPRPLRAFNPHVPQDLENIVLKCLRKEPAERYATAEALAQDLRRFARGDPVEARPQPAWEKLAHRLWRHRVALTAALALFVVLPVVLTVGLVLLAQKEREAVQLREAGEQELYVAQMNSAQEALAEGNFIRYTRLLDRHIPHDDAVERRGWEWYYLDSQRRLELLTVEAHAAATNSLAFTRDRKRLASGGSDGRACVWSVDSGEKRFAVQHGESVNVVAWSRGDKQLVTASPSDALVRFWDGASGQEQDAFPVVEVASADQVRCGVMALAQAPTDDRWAAAWRRDQEGAPSGVLIWGGSRDETPLSIPGPPGGYRTLAWSPDGSRLAAAARFDRFVVWEASTGREVATWSRNWASSPDVAWSPQGGHLSFFLGQTSVLFFETAGWTEFDMHRTAGRVRSQAWSPNGETLAIGASNGAVEFRSMSQAARGGAAHGHLHPVTALAWDGAGIVASGDAAGRVKLWDPTRSADAVVLPGNGHVAFSPDGQFLVTQDDAFGAIIVIEVASSRIVRTLGADEHGETFTKDAAFSPDGQLLAAVVPSKQLLRVWEWRTSRELFRASAPRIDFVAFSPDGRWLAAGGTVWDTGEWQAHAESLGIVLGWSPDSSTLVTRFPGQSTLDLRRAGVWSPFRRSPTSQSTSRTFAWHPHGDVVATIEPGGTFGVYDVTSARALFARRGHAADVKGLVWSPDGSRLASASIDGTVKLWHATTGDELLTLRSPPKPKAGKKIPGFLALAWSPDGKRLAAADGHDVILWEAPGLPGTAGSGKDGAPEAP